jgi:hypothetical protein
MIEMQIHNESGSETDAPVVGRLSSAMKTDPTPTRWTDARRAGGALDEDRRMSPEREAQIRQRLIDGSYNSIGVADEVARRIIRSADL